MSQSNPVENPVVEQREDTAPAPLARTTSTPIKQPSKTNLTEGYNATSEKAESAEQLLMKEIELERRRLRVRLCPLSVCAFFPQILDI